MTRYQQRRTTVANPSSVGESAPEDSFDIDSWPVTRIRANTSHDILDEVLGRLDVAYDPHGSSYLERVGLLPLLVAQASSEGSIRAISKSLARFERSRSWRVAPNEIAIRHHIDDAAGHEELAKKLMQIRDSSESNLATRRAGRSWSVPKGKETSWKTSRRRLVAVRKKTESLEYAILQAVRDPVALDALVYVESWTRPLAGAVSSLRALKTIIDAASRLEAKVGNRRLPDWTFEAADACRTYWRTLGRGEPRRWFVRERNVVVPKNPFSKWFCHLMSALAGLQPKQCQTILRKKPAVAIKTTHRRSPTR